LLDALDWHGLAELQFIVEDEIPRLIDLNGRFYGSLSLAVAAGANLPAIWAGLAIDDVPATPVRARPGVRYQWGSADLRRAVRERRGGLVRDLAGTAPYTPQGQDTASPICATRVRRWLGCGRPRCRPPTPGASRVDVFAFRPTGSGTAWTIR
jgi:hypothetical protein